MPPTLSKGDFLQGDSLARLSGGKTHKSFSNLFSRYSIYGERTDQESQQTECVGCVARDRPLARQKRSIPSIKKTGTNGLRRRSKGLQTFVNDAYQEGIKLPFNMLKYFYLEELGG